MEIGNGTFSTKNVFFVKIRSVSYHFITKKHMIFISFYHKNALVLYGTIRYHKKTYNWPFWPFFVIFGKSQKKIPLGPVREKKKFDFLVSDFDLESISGRFRKFGIFHPKKNNLFLDL